MMAGSTTLVILHEWQQLVGETQQLTLLAAICPYGEAILLPRSLRLQCQWVAIRPKPVTLARSLWMQDGRTTGRGGG
jgi:hypothetical protein